MKTYQTIVKLKQEIITIEVLLTNIRYTELRTHRRCSAKSVLVLPHPSLPTSISLCGENFHPECHLVLRYHDQIRMQVPLACFSSLLRVFNEPTLLTERYVDFYCTRFFQEKKHLNLSFSPATKALKSYNYMRPGNSEGRHPYPTIHPPPI